MNGLVEELFFLEGGADDNHLKTVSQHRDSIKKKSTWINNSAYIYFFI